jgi:hypothetical protein
MGVKKNVKKEFKNHPWYLQLLHLIEFFIIFYEVVVAMHDYNLLVLDLDSHLFQIEHHASFPR